jgi:hypothetical protein
MSFTPARSAAGLALLTALLAGCGASTASQPHAGHPAQVKTTVSCIPQQNGGDHDADNNGGPSDGDGCM